MKIGCFHVFAIYMRGASVVLSFLNEVDLRELEEERSEAIVERYEHALKQKTDGELECNQLRDRLQAKEQEKKALKSKLVSTRYLP